MKPKNFPERKNKRRKEALERLKKSAMKNPSVYLEKAIENTKDKIVEDARMVRSKIGRGKI